VPELGLHNPDHSKATLKAEFSIDKCWSRAASKKLRLPQNMR
jgi:hypothetical protein